MPRLVSIHSFRGGTGKSNIAANVSAQLAQLGNRVGVVDADLQSPGIHVIFGMDEEMMGKSLNDFLGGDAEIEEVVYDVGACIGEREVHVAGGSIHLVPSSLRAGRIAHALRERYDVALLNDGFRALIDSLNLDYLVIDTHPGLEEETLLSIAPSDFLFIVLRPDQQDFRGTAVMLGVVRKLAVPQLFLIINMALPSYDFQGLRKQVEEIYGSPVAAIIPLSEDVARLQSSDLFSVRCPDHPVSESLRTIAELIASGVTSHRQ